MKSNYHLLFLLFAFLIYSCKNPDATKKENNINKITASQIKSQPEKKHKKNSKLSVSIGGTYSFGDNVEKGAIGQVKIYPLTDTSALFYLDVCRGAPSYNLGQTLGKIIITDSVGIYAPDRKNDYFDCKLQFNFTGKLLKIKTIDGHNACGFGHGVYADHIYKLENKSIPKYFINGHGDTISFTGLIAYKYRHRFD